MRYEIVAIVLGMIIMGVGIKLGDNVTAFIGGAVIGYGTRTLFNKRRR